MYISAETIVSRRALPERPPVGPSDLDLSKNLENQPRKRNKPRFDTIPFGRPNPRV
jgi:hypothetical protein